MGKLMLVFEIFVVYYVTNAHLNQVRVERKVCVHEVKKTEVSKEKKW